MTSRRPHWDDDLIDAVRDAVDVEFDDIWKLSEDSIRAVIAAVEDWQEREKTRCKSDTAYHCATHDTQWLDVRTAILREVCPAKNTLLGKQIECDRGIGHAGPHMTKESWQWFDAPERGES